MPEFEKYYDEEIRYLKEAGQEFSEAFPDRARFLNLNDVDDRDPYVERLFEGFAFLSGRIRQKLDDDFPEFTRTLLEIVDPLFLQSLPSLCLLELGFRETRLPRPHPVERGTLFLTGAVGKEASVCRFQSTMPVTLMPLRLDQAEFVHHGHLGQGLKLSFTVDAGADLQPDDWNELAVYLHGDNPLAYFLYEFLTSKVVRTTWESEGRPRPWGGQECVEAGGFGEDEHLLPPLDNSFEGGRFLQEFFAFDEKFRFVRLKNLQALASLKAGQSFNLQFYFDAPVPEGRRVRAENFRLHVTPVVNLFETKAEPVLLNRRHFEYRLMPEANKSTEIHAVLGVIGMDKGTGKRRTYRPFSEFRFHGDGSEAGTFQSRTEPRPGGRQASFLTVTHFEPTDGFQEEYLSVSIRATNGPLPRQELQEGSICNPSPDFPNFSDFSNFTRPSPPLPAPDARHYLWHVLAHLNMNYRSLCQEGVLKEVLSLYDWSRRSANRKLVEGLLRAKADRKRFLMGSQLLSGTEVTVEFREDAFPSSGERLLFARVLLHFLTQYTSINHLVSLVLRLLPSGQEVRLEPLEGRSHPV